ncbi:MAG: acetate kinase [Bacilli bacterium]|nr:acetate kinase [Bacilli bacterium]
MYKVISVNAGSSSLKYKVFEMPEEKVLCSGLADRIMHDDAIFRIKYDGKKFEKVLPIKDHAKAVELLLQALIEHGIVKDLNELKCVGHRVVQGGKYFSKSVNFDEDTEAKITKLIPLDPLHAPAHLVGYHAFKKALPDAKVIAVFDTAFHQTMEPEDYVFPIPYEMTEKYDCRRYGAHGTSHNYLADRAIETIFGGKAEGTRIISCHIGSGASLCAIRDGKCVATSMGLTPLGGVMMGTRSGDLDPSVVDYLCNQTGKSVDEIYDILNKKSGLLGVSGISNDTRDVEKAALEGDERAKLTIKLYARRVADYIGQYFVRLGGADLIIFSAGVGENGPIYRETILKDVEEALDLKVDYEANVALNGKEGIISKPESKIKVAIIPTDEEIMIARDCYKAIEGTL